MKPALTIVIGAEPRDPARDAVARALRRALIVSIDDPSFRPEQHRTPLPTDTEMRRMREHAERMTALYPEARS